MTRHVRLSGADLQLFVRDRALGWTGWREAPMWRDADTGEYLLGMPDSDRGPVPPAGKVFDGLPTGRCVSLGTLGLLWKRAQPVRRGGSDAPVRHLLLLTKSSNGSVDRIVESAAEGVELLELEEAAADGRRFYACLIRGDLGHMLAQAPPEGCEPFECDDVPGGGMAGLPPGWRIPNMLDELWPGQSDDIILYRRHPDGVFHVHELREVRRHPLVKLVASDAHPIQSLPDPTPPQKTKWQVIRRTAIESGALAELDSPERRPVVFRIKTFEPSIRQGTTGPRNGRELGSALLQVLDECEAGFLPEVRYAAVEMPNSEIWHLLHVAEADPRLLDAWSMLDRFEYVPELAEHGISAFVSRESRMIPSIPALLQSSDSSARIEGIVERIRKMLGSPGNDCLVLIEDRIGTSEDSQAAWERRNTQPNIVHVEANASILLSDLIPRIVSDWHNAEPNKARTTWMQPDDIAELRAELENRLREIGEDEDRVLREAAAASQQMLEKWATEARTAIDTAAAPVREAQEICAKLERAVSAAAASFEDACALVRDFCGALTIPRRAWITEQTQRNAGALEEAAPRAEEAGQVAAQAASMRAALDTATDTLRRAITALEALEPGLRDSDRQAASTIEQTSAARLRAERLASEVERRIQDRSAAARRELEQAMARGQQIRSQRAALEQVRAQVSEAERDNDRRHAENQALAAENRRRAADAEQRRQETERVRRIEIPRLEEEAREAAQRLAQLNPISVLADQRAAAERLAQLRSDVASVEADLRALEQARTAISDASSRIVDERARLATVRREAEHAEARLEEARRELEAARLEINQKIAEQGDAKWLRDRLELARRTIEQIRSPEPPRNWWPWRSGGTP